jgi:hypothetical protein
MKKIINIELYGGKYMGIFDFGFFDGCRARKLLRWGLGGCGDIGDWWG